jgi:2-C-methyl-D-erythritol 2,4-cyclodiphosphate synthase
VDIPAEVHLTGHSDADAVCHAITDAVLGAAGLDDIGTMFPDHDPANRQRDSVDMLVRAAQRATGASGLRIVHIDVTVIAESPRIGPYRDHMRTRVAEALGISTGAISIKGKTNEGMGWVGRGEGLACIAVATLA